MERNFFADFSKIEAGHIDLINVEFELHDVLDHLITVLSPHWAAKDIECIIGVDHDVPTRLSVDPLRLGQVLINLAGNAAQFAESGEIRLFVRLEKQETEKTAAGARDTQCIQQSVTESGCTAG